MKKYGRKDGWLRALQIVCGLVVVVLVVLHGLPVLPWQEILGFSALAILLRRRAVTVLVDSAGKQIVAHIPGESVLVVVMLRHGPEAAAACSLVTNVIAGFFRFSYFYGSPSKAFGSLANILWLPFMAYVQGVCYYAWQGTPIQTLRDCQRMFQSPLTVLIPFLVASLLVSDGLNRLMLGVSLRLRYGISWKEALGTNNLFEHIENAGRILSLALWTACGWGTLPFLALNLESNLLAAREWGRWQEARRQATSDPLTGLGNALSLSEKIRRLLERQQPFAVLFLDLDYFKQVNDRFGHGVGDELLSRIGDVLQATVRPRDLVVRRGGDEFVVVLEAMDRPEAEVVRERLQSAVAQTLALDPRFAGVGLSAGLAVAPGDGRTEKTLLFGADQAMYAEKQHRKRAQAA